MAYADSITQAAYAKQHYEANKEVYKARAKVHDAKRKLAIRAFLNDYLSSHPCITCGESDVVVLEFDHRNPDEKDFNIGDFPSGGYSLKRVERELEKCDVRCANCHRRRHAMLRTVIH